eukprot:RCo019409
MVRINGVNVFQLGKGRRRRQNVSVGQPKGGKSSRARTPGLSVIHDFGLPNACSKLRASPDGNFIVAAGEYPPQFHCYEIREMSLKFCRHVDEPIVDFLFLTPDYCKLVFLESRRWVEFHHKAGRHYRLRVPKVGRSLAYHPSTGELLICGSSAEVYRLSLELGSFCPSIATDVDDDEEGINAVRVNPVHELIGMGCGDGIVRCWDHRCLQRSVGQLDAIASIAQAEGLSTDIIGDSISTLEFDVDGITMAVGTNKGTVALYDLRNNRPSVVKDHFTGQPVVRVEFSRPSTDGSAGNITKPLVLSACGAQLKAWDRLDGSPFTAVETTSPINDFLLVRQQCNIKPPHNLAPTSGLIFVAVDYSDILTYFIPELAPAPAWCSALESFREKAQRVSAEAVVQQHSKFLTPAEMDALGLTEAAASSDKIRPWMHGFLVNHELYKRARAVAMDPMKPQQQQQQGAQDEQPEDFDEWLKRRKRAKAQQRAALSFGTVGRPVKLNAEHAETIVGRPLAEAEASAEGGEGAEASKPKVFTNMVDSRFRKVFKDARFIVDQTSEGFLRYHRNSDTAVQLLAMKEQAELAHRVDITDQFQRVDEDEDIMHDLEGQEKALAHLEPRGFSTPPSSQGTVPPRRPWAKSGGSSGPAMFELKPGRNLFSSVREKHHALARER